MIALAPFKKSRSTSSKFLIDPKMSRAFFSPSTIVGKLSAIPAVMVRSLRVTSDELPPTNEMPGKPRRKGCSGRRPIPGKPRLLLPACLFNLLSHQLHNHVSDRFPPQGAHGLELVAKVVGHIPKVQSCHTCLLYHNQMVASRTIFIILSQRKDIKAIKHMAHRGAAPPRQVLSRPCKAWQGCTKQSSAEYFYGKRPKCPQTRVEAPTSDFVILAANGG